MKKYISVGVDYSITGPSIAKSLFVDDKLCHIDILAIHNSNKICSYNYTNDDGVGFSINSVPKIQWENPLDRYIKTSDIFLDSGFITGEEDRYIIEDYSFGSIGNTKSQIIENTAVLKYRCNKDFDIVFEQVSPKSVKKDFSGSGNAKKDDMADAFYQKFNFYIHDLYGRTSKSGNPIENQVDSVAVSLYKLEKNLEE